jgi:hypothetical protein
VGSRRKLDLRRASEYDTTQKFNTEPIIELLILHDSVSQPVLFHASTAVAEMDDGHIRWWAWTMSEEVLRPLVGTDVRREIERFTFDSRSAMKRAGPMLKSFGNMVLIWERWVRLWLSRYTSVALGTIFGPVRLFALMDFFSVKEYWKILCGEVLHALADEVDLRQRWITPKSLSRCVTGRGIDDGVFEIKVLLKLNLTNSWPESNCLNKSSTNSSPSPPHIHHWASSPQSPYTNNHS